jgi:ribosome maturation factor RimP
MILKQTIEALAQEHLQGTPLTLVEVTVSEENDIEVIITREGGGVSIDDCVTLSRFIESKLDRDKEDFSLMVGSAGI